VLPTRNRPDTLERTLDAIGALALPSASEVIVVDNASDVPPNVPPALGNGLRILFVRLDTNEGAAARNHAAQLARHDWLLMLDDDSHPLDVRFLDCAADAPDDVAAIGAEIMLSSGARESGGLPETIIGCGALMRRDAFLAAKGYDPAFQYYAEEYDLCAKFILAGYRVTHDRRFNVLHEKTTVGRDMNSILHKLVRNNGWTLTRYAPDDVRDRAISGTIERYRRIAQHENAVQGFDAGLAELNAKIETQPRTPMSQDHYDRFTGLAAARAALQAHPALTAHTTVAIVDKGKHAWAVRTALEELANVERIDDARRADALVIGTLSPGPMLDAFDRRLASTKPVLMPWKFSEAIPASHRSTRAAMHIP